MKYLGCYLLFIGLFFIDRITKWMIVSSDVVYRVITSWLSFDLQFNRGISWGFFHSHNGLAFFVVSLCVVIITLGIAGYAIYQWFYNKPIYGQVMILAGSISNIIDRIVYGGVVDFIHVHNNSWSFPIFNIADIVIVLGVFVMLIQEISDSHE